jgi:hypothetical protein
MNKRLLFLIFVCLAIKVNASDSLLVTINKHEFKQGDTLEFDCILNHFHEDGLKAVTLNIWIEDVYKNRRWKYRYPLINGEVAGTLAIGGSIPDGKYAVNFLIQKQFFSMEGKVRDYTDYSKLGIIYMMLAKNKSHYIDNLKTYPDGQFKIGGLVFEDTARFVFSPTGKKGNNDLYVELRAPLDSAFVPVFSNTQFIIVGNPNKMSQADTVKKYTFNDKDFTVDTTIPNVTVRAVRKKLVQQFDEEYVTGLFRGGDPVVFDGLESTQISDAIDVYSFLQGKVAGLMVKSNDGQYVLTMRNRPIDVWLDEFKLDRDDPVYVNPSDIAMIKVFKAPDGPTNDGGICIYTKRGIYDQNSSRKYNFLLHGYSPIDGDWK